MLNLINFSINACVWNFNKCFKLNYQAPELLEEGLKRKK